MSIRMLIRIFLLLVLLGSSGAQANTCAQEFAHLAPQAVKVNKQARIIKLTTILESPLEEQKVFVQKVKAFNQKVKGEAYQIAMSSHSRGIKYYHMIGAQVPKEGYVRALSMDEVWHILQHKQFLKGHDFNFLNDGARVGHGGNFIFLICRKCKPEMFQPGELGSSVVNKVDIPIEDLELVIPYRPNVGQSQ